MAKKRIISMVVTGVLLAGNLVAANYLISGWSSARVDLTQEGLYSISPATRRLLTSLDEEVTIHGYFSQRTHPKLAPLVPEIADLLEEYRAVSGGRVHVEVFDPGENEEIELEASERYGVNSSPFRLSSKYESAIVNAYFSVVVKYADQYVRYGIMDLIQVTTAPDGDIDVRLRNLEYDLTRAIKKVVFGFRSTNELFERVEGPVRVTAVWTPEALPDVFAEVPQAMRKAAEDLSAAGGEKFVFEEIDPGDDEAKRREVLQRYGAQPMSVGIFGDAPFFLHALLEVGDRMERLPLTGQSITSATIREAVEDSLRRHTPGFLKTIGVVAPKPDQIPPEMRMQLQMPPQQPPEFNEIQRYLEEDYTVAEVDLAQPDGVPYEIDVLLVLKPDSLDDKQVYNLDQYLMRGGRVILCAGHFDVDFNAGGFQVRPLQTGLDSWLEHYGISIADAMVLDDRNQTLPIPQIRQTPFGAIRTWTQAPYPYLVQVRDDGFLKPEITSSLGAVGIYWGSPLTVDDEKAGDLEILPILQSSSRSWTSADVSQVNFVDYQVPQEGIEPHLLALALSGKFTSYFKDHEPPAFDRVTDPSDDRENADLEQSRPAVPLLESPETRLVVIGNSEFLSDFVAQVLGQIEGGFFVENLRFAQNLIDWTSLDNEMLSIRARGLVSRRLERTEPGSQMMIEAANYVAPVVLLLALGLYLRWRRRQRPQLTVERTVAEEAGA